MMLQKNLFAYASIALLGLIAPSAQSQSGDGIPKLAPLPFAITSFGAARSGSSLYVYGGHTGEAHAYSNDAQSNKLLRFDLSKPASEWEIVAEGDRVQGLGMVSYKNQLIVVGGFTARNKVGDPQDLHSRSTVKAFDLVTKDWKELPSLPEPRSSHDIALVGDILYVVGGWNLSGSGKTDWHETAWSMDLSLPDLRWIAIPNPPMKRRALATIEHQGRLYVIGGMNDQGGPTKAVAIYDPKSKNWSEGPELIGKKGMAGFGASGWSIGGKLIVTTFEGDIEVLEDDSKNWKVIGQTTDARFFHRLIPFNEKLLIAVGGANMESGKFLNLEWIGH